MNDRYLPELSEIELVDPTARQGRTADEVWDRIDAFDDLPEGTLGWAFMEFHRRNDLHLPDRDTPEPAYYVSHDMNHVIAGYDPTGPGEIGLGRTDQSI